MRPIEIAGEMLGHAPARLPVKISRLLVAEDDWLVSMALQEMLTELGFAVAGTASDIASALESIQQSNFDAAILDYWLHGQPIDPVADALMAKSIPFAIASGLGINDIAPRLRHMPFLAKPYLFDDVSRVLAQLG